MNRSSFVVSVAILSAAALVSGCGRSASSNADGAALSHQNSVTTESGSKEIVATYRNDLACLGSCPGVAFAPALIDGTHGQTIYVTGSISIPLEAGQTYKLTGRWAPFDAGGVDIMQPQGGEVFVVTRIERLTIIPQ